MGAFLLFRRAVRQPPVSAPVTADPRTRALESLESVDCPVGCGFGPLHSGKRSVQLGNNSFLLAGRWEQNLLGKDVLGTDCRIA